jgi:hypothetical protein
VINCFEIYAFGVLDEPADDEERPDRAQVELAKLWLCEFTDKATKYLPYTTSYGLKHKVEYTLRKRGAFSSITNGAMILALIESGYEVMRETPRSPNVKVKLKPRRGYHD